MAMWWARGRRDDAAAPRDTIVPTPTLGQRGLVAALVAGMATVQQAEVVRAGSDGDVVPGNNTAANTTTTVTVQTFYPLAGGATPFGGNPIFKADASHTDENSTVQHNVDGIHGVGKGTFSGVVGYGGDNSGNGVYGFGVGTGAGVVGLGGNLFGAAGVLGLGNNASANNGVGVRGIGANGGIGMEQRGGATNWGGNDVGNTTSRTQEKEVTMAAETHTNER